MKMFQDTQQELAERSYKILKEDVMKDIKTVGKELALDIVSLNKKIDGKSSGHAQRMKIIEASLEKLEKKTSRILKQYNSVTH